MGRLGAWPEGGDGRGQRAVRGVTGERGGRGPVGREGRGRREVGGGARWRRGQTSACPVFCSLFRGLPVKGLHCYQARGRRSEVLTGTPPHYTGPNLRMPL